ncbi:MAG TPA: PRC-barrel domain-containing protein, partial [Phycisphaeraceae bacterium]
MRRMHAGQAVSAALALTLAPAATLGQEEMAPPAQEEQQQQPAETPWAQPQQQQPQQDAQAQLEGRTNLVKASKFTDLEVRDSQGQVVGTLQEVAFDVDHGQVAYGVIALSEGNELRLAPCKAFQLDPSGEFATLSISQDQLQQMQAFDDANWQQLSDPQFAQQIHQQFGLQPYWEKQAQPGQMMPLGQAGQMEQFGQQAQQPQEQQQQQEGAYGTTPPSDQTQQQPGMMSQQRIEQSLQRRFQQAGLAEDQAQQEAQQLAQEIQQQQMQQDQIRQRIEQSLTQAGVDQTTAQQYAQVAAQEVQQLQQQAGAQQPGAQQQPGMAMQQPGQVEKLSVLMERQVRDAQGEELAQVSDFIIDTREGRAAYAVLSYGGFAGIGEKLVAVPYNALQPQPQEEAFTLNATRETLDQLAFESDSWPDMTDQQWASRVHQAFNQPPYWEVYGYGAYITT